MKKVFALAIVFTMVFALAIPAAAVNITANKATVAVDGVREDAYAGPIDVKAPRMNASDGFENAPNSATGQAWFAWDDSGIYFYMEVDDKTPNHDSFDNESVEFFIDWNSGRGEADEATDEAPYWQVRFSPVDPASLGGYWRDGEGAHWDQEAFVDLTTHVVVPINGDIKNGYIIEAKFGVPAFSSVAEGKTIPFDIQVCDDGLGEGTRSGQMFVDHIGDGEDDNNKWNTASAWRGLLTLGGAYVAPAAEPEPDVPDAAGGGDSAPEQPVVARPSAPPTGDAGMIVLITLLAVAAAAIVVLRKRAVR